jgi:glycerol-3-phosphate O-acyltransferase/dihydroxyacetone phosphate acyltransferase
VTVPVHRAADEAKTGSGLIFLDDTDPCLVRGAATRFTSECPPKSQIMLPKGLGSVVAEVTEVLSDTELRIKREFGGEGGKLTTKVREKVDEARGEGKQGLGYKRMPFIDQQDMYRHVYQCLKEGSCIGIFPEGVCPPLQTCI